MDVYRSGTSIQPRIPIEAHIVKDGKMFLVRYENDRVYELLAVTKIDEQSK